MDLSCVVTACHYRNAPGKAGFSLMGQRSSSRWVKVFLHFVGLMQSWH